MTAHPDTESGRDEHAVVPLVDFFPSLPDESIDLGHDALLTPIDRDSSDRMSELVHDDTNYLCNFGLEPEDSLGNAEWALVIPLFLDAKHAAPYEEEGEDGLVTIEEFGDFSADLRTAYASTFVTALHLTKGATVWMWLSFRASVKKSRLVASSLSLLPDGHRNPDRLAGLEKGATNHQIQLSDMELLRQLWGGIVSLRRLEEWSKSVWSEEFFAHIDKEASYKAAQGGSKDVDHAQWRRQVRSLFLKQHEQRMNDGSRIARAIDFFERGLRFPHGVGLVMMCIVLESLWTNDSSEVSYKLQTRLAKKLGRSEKEREEYFERAKQVYKARSKLVHGEKGFADIENGDITAAISLARESLSHILVNKKLLSCYHLKKEKELEQLFRKLDLGDAV